MIEWKDIVGYEGVYQVSNSGLVRTLDREIKCGYGSTRMIYGKILSPCTAGKGYLNIGLSKNSQNKKRLIHRLVAEYFVDNPDNLSEVNHKDGDKTNNNYWNLEWSTHANNLDHAHKNELKGKLKHEDVLDIFNSSKPPKELSATYNISVSNISLIRSGKAWSFLTKNSKQ